MAGGVISWKILNKILKLFWSHVHERLNFEIGDQEFSHCFHMSMPEFSRLVIFFGGIIGSQHLTRKTLYS